MRMEQRLYAQNLVLDLIKYIPDLKIVHEYIRELVNAHNEQEVQKAEDVNRIQILERQIAELKETIEAQDEDVNLLTCLRQAGVDNWEGYEHAVELFHELYGEGAHG